MEDRAEFLIGYAEAHAPVNVRQLYYRAEVERVPGIDKDEAGYRKTQRQVLNLRRAGRLDYGLIADATRWMRKPKTYDGLEDVLEQTVEFYRKSLWRDQNVDLEIWIEKDALAGVIFPVTSLYDVPLMVTRGFCSETFAYNSVEDRRGRDRPYVIYSLYDFDRAGHDAAKSLNEMLCRFGAEMDVEVHFNQLALDIEQIVAMWLPTRPAKRNTVADKKWPYPFACELDAIPPDDLRNIVRAAIEEYLPRGELESLKRIEDAERETLRHMLGGLA